MQDTNIFGSDGNKLITEDSNYQQIITLEIDQQPDEGEFIVHSS